MLIPLLDIFSNASMDRFLTISAQILFLNFLTKIGVGKQTAKVTSYRSLFHTQIHTYITLTLCLNKMYIYLDQP